MRHLRSGSLILSSALLVILALAAAAAEPGSTPVAPESVTTAPAATVLAAADDYGPTSDVPWNPPQPMHRRRGWEQAALLPGRVVTLPLSMLSQIAEQGLLYAEETDLVTRTKIATQQIPQRFGFVARPSKLGDRTGLGILVGMRTPFLGGVLRNAVSADYSGTMRNYNQTLVRVRGRPGIAEYVYDWRPEHRFYGIGRRSSEDSLSSFATQGEWVRAGMNWGWNRGGDANAPPRSQLALWGGPRNVITRTGRESGKTSFDERFPAIAASTLDRRVEHLIYGGSFSSDWRTGQPHWSQGWRIFLAGERYDRPIEWVALRVGSPRGAQFTRYTIDTETGFSMMRDPRTLRFRIKVLDQHVTGGDRMLLSDLAMLGGHEGLGGFDAGRFRDVDLMLTRASYVFPLVRRLEVELHSEWGAVYPNVWRDIQFGTLRNSYGFALRGRSDLRPFGAAGLDFSTEGFRFRYTLGAVE